MNTLLDLQVIKEHCDNSLVMSKNVNYYLLKLLVSNKFIIKRKARGTYEWVNPVSPNIHMAVKFYELRRELFRNNNLKYRVNKINAVTELPIQIEKVNLLEHEPVSSKILISFIIFLAFLTWVVFYFIAKT
jgi:hypothetical protein